MLLAGSDYKDGLDHWRAAFKCKRCCHAESSCNFNNKIKILLLHGQMKPLLRLASSPGIHLEKFFYLNFSFPIDRDCGWGAILHTALAAYLILNILFLKPETWPSTPHKPARSRAGGETPQDYRLTAAYQRMVRHCTGKRIFDVEALPHRLFFGMPLGALHLTGSDKLLVGRFPLQAQFSTDFKGSHIHSIADVDAVFGILRFAKHLPTELALEIMKLAAYEPQSRLGVVDDPLHPDNADELRKYLRYCWRLLVHCEVLAVACGNKKILWEEEVKECVKMLFFDYPGVEKRFKQTYD